MTGSNRPILLKKSAVFSKAEKYASEIEILNVRRAFQAEISRRSVLKRRFHPSILRHSEKTDFFNRIGQKRSLLRKSVLNATPRDEKKPRPCIAVLAWKNSMKGRGKRSETGGCLHQPLMRNRSADQSCWSAWDFMLGRYEAPALWRHPQYSQLAWSHG